jgi:uncharacterized protein
MSEPRPRQRTQAVRPARTSRTPALWAWQAFALTTFVLSMVNSNIIPQSLVAGAHGLAFAYGCIAQLAAGLWEFA